MTRLLLLALAGCAGMNSARPLEQGEHAVGLTFGGPMLEFAGAPIPMPNAILQGRHGLAPLAGRPTDLHYGLNLTAAAFGVAHVHVGAAHLLLPQRGGVPALSVADRVHFATNILDPRKDLELRGAWALNELELTASWAPRGQLVYVGLNDALDFAAPELLLTPFLGAAFDPGDPGGLGVQLEGRWYAASTLPRADVTHWVGPGRGAIGATLGLSYRFGGAE
ncbi:MAG: hypothetical protein H6741_18355 [Alphaproteobacteria bacterium]|nr:hypothetical protein [Alphaproteobacteria bacterium]MCB9794679.1 hypothetical protein [Alphaproteobacteria bacterium]